MQYIVLPLSMVYNLSITLVSISGTHPRSILESHSLTNVKKKLKDYFLPLTKYKIKLTNGLLVSARFHMTVFMHLLGMCYLIY